MTSKRVFLAATGQNVGKTTNSLGLYARLVGQGIKTGFIKPVGQRYLKIDDLKIDEDSFLVHEVYKPDIPLQHMSPVAVPRGFTESAIDAADTDWIKTQILESFQIVSDNREFVVIEGTGHTGVGSVFDANNAQVAKWLGSKVVLVTGGGIGKSIDELHLNQCLFKSHGVELMGVIINKVFEEKYDKIKKYTGKALEKRGIKLLGVLPYQQKLSNPNMEQIAETLGASMLHGVGKLNPVENVIVGAMSVPNMLKHIKEDSLIITPGDREDIVLAALSWDMARTSSILRLSGLILTGGVKPGSFVSRIMKKSRIPILYTKHDTFETASMVNSLMVKITTSDHEKIELSQQLFHDHVDFDYIMENC